MEPAEAYTQVGGLHIEPSQIEISGPLSYVDTIQAIGTDSLILQDLEEDVNQILMLRKPAGRRIHIDPTVVTISADIQILAEVEISGIPVQVRYTGERDGDKSPARAG